MIACRCWLGGEILVPAEQLVHRPSAYGIVRRGDMVLLMTTVGVNGRYCLPGGGIEPYETNAVALQRELVEEAGIQAEVGPLVHFQEDFFYYDPTGDACTACCFTTAARRSPLTCSLPSKLMTNRQPIRSGLKSIRCMRTICSRRNYGC